MFKMYSLITDWCLSPGGELECRIHSRAARSAKKQEQQQTYIYIYIYIIYIYIYIYIYTYIIHIQGKVRLHENPSNSRNKLPAYQQGPYPLFNIVFLLYT